LVAVESEAAKVGGAVQAAHGIVDESGNFIDQQQSATEKQSISHRQCMKKTVVTCPDSSTFTTIFHRFSM